MNAVDVDMLRAHQTGDIRTLIALYTRAGDQAEAAGDIDKTCFFLTHAFIYALEQGAAEARSLQARLHEYGREAAPKDTQ